LCIGMACPPFYDPDKGNISSCSHVNSETPWPGGTFINTCDGGYMVEGDITVTCLGARRQFYQQNFSA